MNYLDPTEYARFGLEAETPDDLVLTASAVLDGYCRRPTLGIASYTERWRLSGKRCAVRLSYGPLAAAAGAASAVTSLRVRTQGVLRGSWLPELAEAALTFGAAPAWLVVDPATAEITEDGWLELMPTLLPIAVREIEVGYSAGYSVVPDAVKAACAQIVRNAQAMPALGARDIRMDTMRLQYFSDSLVDEGTAAVLRPYVAERQG